MSDKELKWRDARRILAVEMHHKRDGFGSDHGGRRRGTVHGLRVDSTRRTRGDRLARAHLQAPSPQA